MSKHKAAWLSSRKYSHTFCCLLFEEAACVFEAVLDSFCVFVIAARFVVCAQHHSDAFPLSDLFGEYGVLLCLC